MTTTPNPKTGATIALNLWTNGGDQWAAWYRGDGELVIGRRRRASQVFGRDHDQYVVAGTPRTVLALPVEDDDHNYPSMMVDGNGRVHVWANMHNQPLRAIRTVDPGDSDTWLTDAGWTSATSDLPDMGDRVTYPTPMRFADGSFGFYARTGDDGLSGQYNSYMWSRTATGTTWGARRFIWQGLEVPDAGGPGIPGGGPLTAETDRTNWSVYPTNFYVESVRDPHPGRVHVSFVWRCEGVDGNSNVWPSYMYSDDNTLTWRTIDGTALTLPITPLNSVAARCTPACKGAWVRSISRDGAGVVVAVLDTENHGFGAGDTIHCRVINTALDGQFTVGAVDPSGLGRHVVAWGQAGSAITSGGTGSVTTRRYLNWGSITVDRDGLPHICASGSPMVYIRRNAANTAWVETTISNPVGGETITTRFGGLFWFRGQLWGLALGGTPTWGRRAHLWQLTNPGPVRNLSHGLGSTSNYEPSHDPEAWRLHESIEVLAPDGDRPQVGVYGPHGARRKVA